MSHRRSRFEIIQELLDVIIDGETKPTRIMYRTNLSFNTLTEILNHLVEGDLINKQKVQSGEREFFRYNITEKGRNVAKYYKNLAGLINTESLRIEF